ncbi:MAG: HAMP domain-containing histidine kinase [Ignavibacteriae bacterium]|nr:HAMP domain-containing histidine kinase [Ignavibacteriota bacterium]
MNKFGSLNIKIALLLSGVVIALGILYYTQTVVTKIQIREAQIADLYAKSLEYIANDTSSTGEYNFIFNEIILQIDFPIIATDKEYKNVEFHKNVEIDTNLSLKKRNEVLLALANDMKEINPPVKVTYQDSIVLSYVNYGQSSLVTQMKYLPFFEFMIAGIFILLGYIGFSYIKKHEQSNIWVGLSKETAHQLGTPLSSLLGWQEMLKEYKTKSVELDEISSEIGNDLEKLKKITGRFSKIGSQPKLVEENITEVIKGVCNYFEKRIPSLVSTDGKVSKKVSVNIHTNEKIIVKINKDLFEWVIENLLKNALDAIDKNTGSIDFRISDKGKEVILDISDSGKGIDKKFKKDIFRPGYSTKRRGWGLGLSLAKRIIDDYHKGKLFMLESVLDSGTTFRIKLQK